MGSNILQELEEWWIENHNQSENEDRLHSALYSLGVIKSNESVVSSLIDEEWEQYSEEAYRSIASINLMSDERVRTAYIAAYAVITPPGIPLDQRIDTWRNRLDSLRDSGVRVPGWYLVWKATIYVYHPPHSLVDFTKNNIFSTSEVVEICSDLKKLLLSMSSRGLHVLDLPYSLRTDSFNVYYCGMGFDMGELDQRVAETCLIEYEAQVLPSLPTEFVQAYRDLT